MLHRLHRVLWSWQGQGFFHDHDQIPIHLWQAPIQWLKRRLAEAWQQLTLGELGHRKTFRGLANMNPRLTTKTMTTHPILRGILQTALNGTFFTADCLKHRTEDADTTCKFCGEPDSQIHRHWECKHFAHLRPSCPAVLSPIISDLEPATKAHGWMPAPESLELFLQALHTIPDMTSHFESDVQALTGTLELFTDGGATQPNEPLARLASWGVAATTTGSWDYKAISCGILPGGHQTVLRAEITGHFGPEVRCQQCTTFPLVGWQCRGGSHAVTLVQQRTRSF